MNTAQKTEFFNEDSYFNPTHMVDSNPHLGTTDLKKALRENKEQTDCHKTYLQKLNSPITPVVKNKIKLKSGYSLIKESWEGRVVKIKDGKFFATLINDDGEKIEGEFLLEDLSDADKNIIDIDTIFYWKIGTSVEGNSRKNQEQIILRRLPVWKPILENEPSELSKNLIKYFNDPENKYSASE